MIFNIAILNEVQDLLFILDKDRRQCI